MENQTNSYVENLLKYHCPRWEELPELELYIDQVTTFLRTHLQLFYPESKSPFLTASMINNYVKQGILDRPVKKKYNRSHLAHLFVICVMKRLFSISDIGESLENMKKMYAIPEGYNLFCEELESALQRTFGARPFPPSIASQTDSRSTVALKAVTQAFSSVVLAEHLIFLRQEEQSENSKK